MNELLFIGLGNMGIELARHVNREAGSRGFHAVGYDLDPARGRLAEERFGMSCSSDVDALEGELSVLCLSVPDGKAVKSALSSVRLKERLRGAVVFDFSSISPAEAVSIASDLESINATFFDAPVTGEVRRGADGTLVTMVGGQSSRFEDFAWVPESFSRSVVRAGKNGNGALLKTLNNMIANVAAVASMEGMSLARKAGIDEDAFLEIFNSGVARTHFSAVRYPDHIATGAFDHGFPLGLVNKDLTIAAESAEAMGAHPSVFAAALALWREALAEFGPSGDTTRIIEVVASRTVGETWSSLIETAQH